MKILVLSDTHGDTDVIAQLLEREAPACLVHLGDCSGDVQYAMLDRAPIPLFQVCGNCDGFTQLPAELEAEIGGKRFFVLHGHTRDVKSGDAAMLAAAKARNADVVLYGHTHIPRKEEKDGVLLLNPGSARRRAVFGRRATYAVVEIGSRFSVSIEEVDKTTG